MHGVLLGVQKLLIELRFVNDFSGKPFSFYKSVGDVDKRMLSILPTRDKYWKASEFRFLFYSFTV